MIRLAAVGLVSVDWDGDGACARVNTTLQRQKGRNLLADPKVSQPVVDPDNTGRFVQFRDAELISDGTLEHLDALNRSYTRHFVHYGYITRSRSVRRRGSSAGSIHGGSLSTPSTPKHGPKGIGPEAIVLRVI